ncbi:MAG: hypothetical protein WEA56_08180 [Balneolaceae bacterium]
MIFLIIKQIFKTLILSLIIFMICCSKSQGQSSKSSSDSLIIDLSKKKIERVRLEKIETLPLNDNIYHVSLFAIFHEEEKRSLVFLDEQQATINKLDIDSGDIISIGKGGRGPFEYVNPSYVRTKHSEIYVWDAMQLKFIVFDEKGNEIRESKTLTRALIKFDVINEDSLALYMSGGFEGPSVGIYSFSEETVFEENLTGEQTKSDRLLTILRGSGGILSEYPYIFYVLPGSLNIHVYNMITNEEKVIEIVSPNFQVDEFDDDVNQFVNTNRNGLEEYLLNNSSTMGIYRYQDFLIIKTINGKAGSITSSQGNFSHDNRYYLFYLLNNQFDVVGYFKRNFNFHTEYEIFNNELYELVFQEYDQTAAYEIHKYSLNID